MQSFSASLGELIDALDPERDAAAVATLKRCRRFEDLDALAGEGGWLNPQGTQPRLRLVKHGSGTFLVLAYEDGWGTTLGKAEFWRR